LQFNEKFGLGSHFLSCGEEDVFLKDAQDQRMNIRFFPITIGTTNAETTGTKFLTDVKVQRSKGATFAYCFGLSSALWRMTKEALHYFIYKGKNPFPLWWNMWKGTQYVRKWKK
jgi:hypothetical protein